MFRYRYCCLRHVLTYDLNLCYGSSGPSPNGTLKVLSVPLVISRDSLISSVCFVIHLSLVPGAYLRHVICYTVFSFLVGLAYLSMVSWFLWPDDCSHLKEKHQNQQITKIYELIGLNLDTTFTFRLPETFSQYQLRPQP